ncbi:hypothetical protein J6590_083180 [Homalodisca vitripennis]|nr:hypothetical protein J6590_083180 [Homalodisca vitripennis]
MLAASSTVSGGWRGCFNHKWMWWQHCNADTAEYLEAAECRVEPRFESLESEDSTLTCLYKKPHCNADTAEYLETAECRWIRGMNLRSHRTGRHRTVVYERLPSQAGVHFINRLPNELRKASTLKALKTRLKRCLVSNAFYNIKEFLEYDWETIQ